MCRKRERCIEDGAGVVEFASTGAPAQAGPLEFIKRQIAALFPELSYYHMSEWMGRRPATTDSLPLIGPARAIGNGHVAFGHQHVGLTAGPKTVRLIADRVIKHPNNAELSALDPAPDLLLDTTVAPDDAPRLTRVATTATQNA